MELCKDLLRGVRLSYNTGNFSGKRNFSENKALSSRSISRKAKGVEGGDRRPQWYNHSKTHRTNDDKKTRPHSYTRRDSHSSGGTPYFGSYSYYNNQGSGFGFHHRPIRAFYCSRLRPGARHTAWLGQPPEPYHRPAPFRRPDTACNSDASMYSYDFHNMDALRSSPYSYMLRS